MSDFTLADHGSLIAVRPHSDAARDWLDDNVHADDSSWLGRSLMVEARYAGILIAGILDAGFEIGE